jgi:hypothetical protein
VLVKAGRPSGSPDSKATLASAAALLGCPGRNADRWLKAEAARRVEEAKAAGVSDAQAAKWAAAWCRLAQCVIEASSC